MRFLLVLVLTLFVQPCWAQIDTLNQFNQKGERTGYWIGYYDTGQKQYEAQFKNGQLVGAMKRYYPNDSLKALIVETEEPNVFTARLFDEQGNLRATGFYKNQLKTGSWEFLGNEAQVLTKITYNKDQLSGTSWRYHPTGEIEEITNWQNNRLHGIQTIFSLDGYKQIEIFYHAGVMEGAYRVLFPNGSVEIAGTYRNNKKHGNWTYYLPDGSINFVLSYAEGKLLNQEVLNQQQEANFKAYEENRYLLKDPKHYLQDPESYFRK